MYKKKLESLAQASGKDSLKSATGDQSLTEGIDENRNSLLMSRMDTLGGNCAKFYSDKGLIRFVPSLLDTVKRNVARSFIVGNRRDVDKIMEETFVRH